MELLLVEDDRVIATGLFYSLCQEGYEVTVCHSCEEARSAIASHNFSLCLLDLTLPDGSGYDLCSLIKGRGNIPVIFLTACDDEGNVVMGLDMGADDYVTKPFRLRELLSRIRTVLRRYGGERMQTQITAGDLVISTTEARVFKAGTEIVLTSLEYRLLLIFAGHMGQVLSRGQLLENLWDAAGDFVNDNTLTVYIKGLLYKIEDDPLERQYIKTVRGLGYRFGTPEKRRTLM